MAEVARSRRQHESSRGLHARASRASRAPFPVSFNLTDAVGVTNGPELTKGGLCLHRHTHKCLHARARASLLTHFLKKTSSYLQIRFLRIATDRSFMLLVSVASIARYPLYFIRSRLRRDNEITSESPRVSKTRRVFFQICLWGNKRVGSEARFAFCEVFSHTPAVP